MGAVPAGGAAEQVDRCADSCQGASGARSAGHVRLLLPLARLVVDRRCRARQQARAVLQVQQQHALAEPFVAPPAIAPRQEPFRVGRQPAVGASDGEDLAADSHDARHCDVPRQRGEPRVGDVAPGLAHEERLLGAVRVGEAARKRQRRAAATRELDRGRRADRHPHALVVACGRRHVRDARPALRRLRGRERVATVPCPQARLLLRLLAKAARLRPWLSACWLTHPALPRMLAGAGRPAIPERDDELPVQHAGHGVLRADRDVRHAAPVDVEHGLERCGCGVVVVDRAIGSHRLRSCFAQRSLLGMGARSEK